MGHTGTCGSGAPSFWGPESSKGMPCSRPSGKSANRPVKITRELDLLFQCCQRLSKDVKILLGPQTEDDALEARLFVLQELAD